jgi:hypothetical protein
VVSITYLCLKRNVDSTNLSPEVISLIVSQIQLGMYMSLWPVMEIM